MRRDRKTLEVLRGMNDPARYKESRDFFTDMLDPSKSEAKEDEKPQPVPAEKDAMKKEYCRADLEKSFQHPIFEAEDWVAYRSVVRFYMGEYKDALAVSIGNAIDGGRT